MFLFLDIITMPNPWLNQTEKNVIGDNIIKGIKNHFRKKKKYNEINDKIVRYIKTLFESDTEDYYKSVWR